MKNVLLVLSSPRGDKSYSHRIANQVIDEIRTDHPGARVVVRDLVKNPLPHVAEPFVSGFLLPAAERNGAQAEALRLSDALIDEVEAADVIVLAGSMANAVLAAQPRAALQRAELGNNPLVIEQRGVAAVEKRKTIQEQCGRRSL